MDKKRKKSKETPYDRFKVIMDKAAGTSTADYEGYGRFWNTLSLRELQKVSIYGVKMIAPRKEFRTISEADDSHVKDDSCCQTESSCCHDDKNSKGAGDHDHEAGEKSKKSFPGRGAASGLVKGLKGEFPFDDTQFPRMPFGGQPVSVEDIAFIESWIDAGCPDDEMPEESGSSERLDPLTIGQKAHSPVSNVNTFKYESGELLQRKNADTCQRRS